MNITKNSEIKIYKEIPVLSINLGENVKRFFRLPICKNVSQLKKAIEEFKETSKNPKFKKKLLLKGLGYKPTVETGLISFKLNYSHPVNIKTPSFIKNIKTVKKSKKFYVSIDSSDKIQLGNFTQKIIDTKPADIYKGKGFRIKGKKMRLKQIKKK